jgi:broad specificity phosphatase PhoE/dienelactone hydrolase
MTNPAIDPGPDGRWIHLARHLETTKNVMDIHGRSALANITAKGYAQGRLLATTVKRRWAGALVGVLATQTPQAISSARMVARMLDVPYEGELDLAAVDLGIAAGRTAGELFELNPVAFRSLDLFRARVISAAQLTIPGAESAGNVQDRLLHWWAAEGRERCPGRLVVGSNSTILMLSHFLNGVLPLDHEYKFLGIPNGATRAWYGSGDSWTPAPQFGSGSWPEVELAFLESKYGSVAITRHMPSWAPRDRAIVLVPGYFGSSRHGPYGLYSRLARAWAWAGYETLALDPLGSGDSSTVFRDFISEVHSVEVVCERALDRASSLLIVGHSMGGATALRAGEHLNVLDCRVWCFAPLCRLEDLSRTFLSERQRKELLRAGQTYRHGLELRRDMIDSAGAAWDECCRHVDGVWVADGDLYTRGMDLSPIPVDSIHHVAGADHNFSGDDGVPMLIDSTTAELAAIERGRQDRIGGVS